MGEREFRRAKVSDSDGVRDVLIQSRKAFLPYAPLAHSDEEVLFWVRTILIPLADVIVASDDDKVVGMISVSEKESIFWIDQLYLLPAYVGSGIGSNLLKVATSKIKGTVRLHTFQQNMLARRFYEKHGFTAKAFSDGFGNEERCPDVLYEKTI